jgi:hypothetical protein
MLLWLIIPQPNPPQREKRNSHVWKRRNDLCSCARRTCDLLPCVELFEHGEVGSEHDDEYGGGPMRNWQRWTLTLALGFLGGLVQCASGQGNPALRDYVRAGLIGLGPAIACLNITLNQNETSAEKSKGMSA